jgi:hypothetical protein
MNIRLVLSAFVLSALFLALNSCSKKHPHLTEVATLDSLMQEVQLAKLTFDSLDASKVEEQLGQINRDVKKLQSIVGVTLTKEEAGFFNDYNNTKRLIKDFPDQYRRIEKELARTTVQLSQLKEALKKQATVDGSGNEISEEYVKKQMKAEGNVASHLIEEIEEMAVRVKKANARFENESPQATAYLNGWTSNTNE